MPDGVWPGAAGVVLHLVSIARRSSVARRLLQRVRVPRWKTVRLSPRPGCAYRHHIARYCDAIAAIPHTAAMLLNRGSHSPKLHSVRNCVLRNIFSIQLPFRSHILNSSDFPAQRASLRAKVDANNWLHKLVQHRPSACSQQLMERNDRSAIGGSSR